MRLEFAHLRENIEACEATIAASSAVLAQMADCLTESERIKALSAETGVSERAIKLFSDIAEQFEVTHGSEIRQIHPTSADTPKGLLCIATDGERADGRLAWVPGA